MADETNKEQPLVTTEVEVIDTVDDRADNSGLCLLFQTGRSCCGRLDFGGYQ